MSGRGWAVLRAVFLPASVAILAMAAMVVPLPVYVETPGTPLSLQTAVAVEELAVGDVRGDYLLTTVNLRSGTMIRLLTSLADGETVLMPVAAIVPPGEDRAAYFERQREVFRSSAELAAAVGLAAAGVDVDPTAITGEGVLVGRVLPGSPAEGRLRPGDLITAVDEHEIRVGDDLREALSRSGDAVDLRVVRDDAPLTQTVRPTDIDTPSGPIRGIGVEIQTANPRVDLPVGVAVDGGSIGGPSAGLMVALTVFDKVSAEDLAAGRVIAGTGTITGRGEVGAIGGVGPKVVAAHREGADIFMTPMGQLDAARAAVPEGSDLEVVGVATFDEALASLRPAP
jgi:PDZ domain-containing protein